MSPRILAPEPRKLRVLPELASHERVLTCTGCGVVILVCCHVNDLDPNTYLGVACGCRKPVI